jgi:hypothetical protein
VLKALALCMLVRRIPPQWLRFGFVDAYFDVAYFAKFKSWDDVFGEAWKGRHLNSAQKEAVVLALGLISVLLQSGRPRR